MKDMRTGKDLQSFPVLEEPMCYIYVLLNSDGKVKIGKTTNVYKRYLSLCGSNGQGNDILYVLVSPETYLYSIERIIHDKFSQYRIPDTEWFYDEDCPDGRQLFKNAGKELQLLFSSSDYEKCNETRKRFNEK